MSPIRGDAVWSIDDLELELRKLPGVRAAGFEDNDDMLLVQLHVEARPESDRSRRAADQPVPVSASRIAARHSDRPVAVEVVRWRSAPVVAPQPLLPASPAPVGVVGVEVVAADAEAAGEQTRARLLAVLAFPDTDELEVHLVLDGKRTIGRAPVSKGIEGAVQATIDAVHDLGTEIHARIGWARPLDEAGDQDQVVVAVALDGVDSRSPLRYGLAAGTSLIDAAARATLDALNRHLSRSP
ncbi:MAG TPA: hypothetical protein VIK54_10240 [Acidimicrobiia bacterium]